MRAGHREAATGKKLGRSLPLNSLLDPPGCAEVVRALGESWVSVQEALEGV